MRITRVDPFILHIPIQSGEISDSTHTISHWGVVGCRIETTSGIAGYGFTGTHAHLPSDRLITSCISGSYAELLVGEDAADIDRLWKKLARFPALQWVGRSGITQLALAAVDIALWDIRAKAADRPLWSVLGGATSDTIEAYNTDIGWLSIPEELLVAGSRAAVERDGFRRVKLKVGHDNPGIDLRRIERVRTALGSDIAIAIDGNGKWDLPTCMRFCARAEPFDIYWFEEPLWYDDVNSHRELALSTSIPVALGEQLYNLDAFNAFMDASAIHYVQPDVTRLGGITEYIQVAHAAHARRLPVAAHAGDMSQVHVHLAFWHPASSVLEYIPWIKDWFEEPIAVEGGLYRRPSHPGAGSTPSPAAFERFAKPL